MQNIDVRFNASSNFTKVKADLAALQAQAASLGAVFEKSAYAGQKGGPLVDENRWRSASRAVHEASRAYRDAASSSGLLNTQQIRATSMTEQYTKALQKQKLAFGDMRKHAGIMKEVYRDQLRMQRMTAQYWGTDASGRAITDITIPKNVPRDLNTAAQRMHFLGEMTKSASTQFINLGKNMQWAGRQLTVGFTYPMAMVGAAAGVMAYKVEDAFGSINKVYDVSAAAQKNEALRAKELANVRVESLDMARKAAHDYGVSVQSTLQVEQQLAATGMTMADGLLEATKNVQRISAIGDIDAGVTADMVVSLTTAFDDLKGDSAALTDTLNYMNAASNATSLSLQDIAEMTPRAASAMGALGVSAKEMTVMMVSMREAGVDAAEGANALKSATGTILAPSPAALKFIESVGGGKLAKGFENLAKTSKGNLYEAFHQIFEMTRGLSDLERQQILVKLFGKYQFNRVSAMLKNLGAAFDGTTNQARKAMDLMGQSASENAKQAAASLKDMTETPAGKFRSALETLKADLAEIGTPFLNAATQVLEATSKVVTAFEGMDDWKKKAIAVAAVVAALAGPLVMAAGLFMNLSGQFFSGLGRIMTWAGKAGGAVGLLNKEETAAMHTAEAQNRVFAETQTKTSTLAAEINVLTAAYEKATAAAAAYAQSQGVVGAQSTAAAAATQVRASQFSSPIGPQLPPISGPLSYSYRRGEDPAAARAAALRQAQMAEMARLRTQDQLNQRAAQEARIREKVAGSVNGASIAMGAMALSAGAMMLPLGETANSIAKWAMIGSIVVPAVTMLGGGLKTAAVAGWEIVASQVANARATMAAAGSTSMLTTGMVTARAAAVGFGTALNAALGPIGWITLGLTAVVGAFMVIKNHNDKIKAEQEALVQKQIEANKVLMESTASIATNMGKAAGSYQQIMDIGGAASEGKGTESALLKSYNYYKSDEGIKETEGLQSDGKLMEADALMTKLQTKFIDLQVLGNDTAEQAKTDLQAMLMAAGASSAEAMRMADEVYKKYGDINKVDWAGPLQDQTDQLTAMAHEAFQLKTSVVTSGGFATILTDFTIDEGKKKLLYQQAAKTAQIFSQALMTETNPAKAKQIIDQFMQAATSQWQVGFDQIMSMEGVGGFDKVKDLFAQYGIDSGEAFAAEMRKNGDFEKAFDDLLVSPSVNSNLAGVMKNAEAFATEYEHSFISPLAKNSGALADNVLTAATALEQLNAAGYGLDADQATDYLLEQNQAYKEYAAIQEQINNLMRTSGGKAKGTKEMLDLQNQLNAKGKVLTKTINELNQAYGFKQGKNATQALNYLLNQTKASADGAEKSVKNVDKALQQLPTRQTVTIKVNQVGGIIQSAMSSVQDAMANSAMNKFNAGWDATMASTQAAQEAASNALDRQQQNAQDAFENRWERRKEAVEKAYQQRIDRINREIEAEQRADEVRQRLFEKEKARLQQLAEAENTNIDFNTALNEGRLDDAAKTLNNAGVKADSDQMDAEQKAAEARTQARIKALEKKNERLEKQRDKEIKQLEKMEERMRKHLERIQAARAAALQKQQEDQMASLQRQRDYEEAMLEQRLELFKSYTARNQKDLEKWMREVGLSYDDFGADVKAKGETWATYFRTELSAQIRKAGTEVMNDNIWTEVGKKMGEKLVKGLGFKNMADFRNFVRTGNTGGQGGKGGDETETRHEGGMIGSGMGSRGNIPNTYKGLHRTEKMVRAQKGEYMVNKNAAAKNLGLLSAINSGTDVSGVGGLMAEGSSSGLGAWGSAPGVTGLMTSAIMSMYQRGIEKSMNNAYQVGLAKQRKLSGPGGTYTGTAGTYGGRSFSAEQMKNAAIIASVGAGMGMSSRDLMIGIMTSIAESGLVNVNYGDRDSLGLFQQRPSMGWGTAAQVTNPRYAAGKFFGVLKAHGERGSEAPWLAAQHVQRSAFADGSNYQRWWAAAQAIFGKGLSKKAGGGYGVSGGYVPGPGGRHRPINGPVTNGLHGGSTAGNPPAVDMAGPTGRAVYAVADGVINQSRDIAGPLPTDSYNGDGPYGSFGRMIVLNTDSGASVLYAHLSSRGVAAGQRVKGGSVIGRSGNTGNSSGPHLHFGATNGPYAWLRRGGKIRYDNTPVIAHKGETMLSARMTKAFENNVASGGGDRYDITIDLRGAAIKEDVDIEKAVNKAIDARENKVGRKRVVK